MRMKVALLFLLIFCSGSFTLAQDSADQKSNWLLGVIFKLENLRDQAIADSQKYEAEIQACDNTISKSENIVRLAQQKGNVKAQTIASEAVQKAQEARSKNLALKNSAVLNKQRAEFALASVKNTFSASLSNPQNIKSVITSYSGRVSIQKKNGEHFTLGENQKGLLEAGDDISTYENGRVELQFLDGRGTMKVGECSRVKMEADSAGTQVMNMLQGKINISVEKLENYQQTMKEKINAYKEDLKTVKDWFKQAMVDEYEASEKIGRAFAKKFEVRTPSAAVAVRATQFLVYEDEKKGTEVIVLDGSVEMRGTKGEKTVIVNTGYKGTATKDGTLSDPEELDIANIDRWWEQ